MKSATVSPARSAYAATAAAPRSVAGFALYSRHGDEYVAHSLNLLTFRGEQVTSIAAFLTPALFPAFGLATTIVAPEA